MSSYDILSQNKDRCLELIKPVILYEPEVSLTIDYNFIETLSMLSYENRIFYEKNIIINGSIIMDRQTSSYYRIYFDPMIYYENTIVKVIFF